MSEWKPGDVAMVTGRWIRTEDHSERYAVKRPGRWWSRSGIPIGDWEVSGIRPLVVIDPEDREQVERLAAAYTVTAGSKPPWHERRQSVREKVCHELALALREFADPKPPRANDAREDAVSRLMTMVDEPTPEKRRAHAEWVLDAILAAVAQGVSS